MSEFDLESKQMKRLNKKYDKGISKMSKNVSIRVKSVTPISTLIKIIGISEEKGIQNLKLETLFQLVYKLAKKYGVYLYDFEINHEGKITSSEFWNDVNRMVMWGYAERMSPCIRLTEEGKELSNWLVLDKELEDKVKTLLSQLTT